MATFALFAGTAAQAQLSADTVWQSWQDYAAEADQEISAVSEARAGNTLTVSEVTISSAIEEVAISTTIGQIAFVEQDDGTVAITMSDAYDMTMQDDRGDGLVLGIRHPGMTLSASETETGLNYDLRAPEMEIAVVEIMGDDAPEEFDVSITASSIAGSYEVPTELSGPVAADLRAAALNAAFSFIDSSDAADMTYALNGAHLNFSGNALSLMEEGDPAAALRDGFAIDLGMGFDTMRYNFMIDERGSRSEAAGGSADGDTRFVMNAQELAFSTSSRNGEITVSGDEIPFPAVTLRAAETALSLMMPLSAAPDPQDVSITTRLVDLTVTDDVWAMFDPMERLPRNPATLIFDLAGQVMVPNDLFSEDTAMGVMMGGPEAAGELRNLELNELELRFAGAHLVGDGSFTFDNSDLETFDGLPRPTGVLELALTGGNRLLDTLVEMGLVPEEDAMGARMMVALFTRPGDGEDELLTTLEVREDGAVLANGQRLQ